MNKFVFIMPLMAISFLASCGKGSSPTKDIDFSIQESSVNLTDKTATIHLDWNPSGDVIEFSNFTFTLKEQTGITARVVTPGEAGSRPLELTIIVSDKLRANDTGTLKFHYHDTTMKKEGDKDIDIPVTNVCTVTFTGENCVLKDENDEEIITKQYTGGTILNYHFVVNATTYNFPTDSELSIRTDDGDFEDYRYDSSTGKLSITLTDNISINATASEKGKIHYILLTGDTNLKLEKERVSFVTNNFKPIPVNYTINDGYSADSYVINPTDAATLKFDFGNKVVITPTKNEESTITIISAQRRVSLLNTTTMEFEEEPTFGNDYVEIKLKLKGEEMAKDIYACPPNKKYFRIAASDGSKPSFTYERGTTTIGEKKWHATIKITDLPLPVKTLSYQIYAVDYQLNFNVNYDLKQPLIEPDVKVIADREENFEFRLLINQYAPYINEEEHVIPYTLDIKYQDGSSMPKDAYTIVASDTTRQHATVTIIKDYITSNFTVAGEALSVDAYEYEISTFGVGIEGPGEEDYRHGYGTKGEGQRNGFELKGEGCASLDESRVIIVDNDGECYRLSDESCPSKYKDCITLIDTPPNETNADETKTLLINSPMFDYAHIYIVVPGCGILNKLEWSSIAKIADKGWGQDFFKVGETKPVWVNRVTYTARIIGFNHDPLTEDTSKKASITFELAELISNEDGSLRRHSYSLDGPSEFNESNYKYVSDILYESFEQAVRENIKQVKKPYYRFNEGIRQCDMHVFPLSLAELDLGYKYYYVTKEGTPYEYYKDKPDSFKKKCPVGSETSYTYFTRSHGQARTEYAFTVNANGESDGSYQTTEHGFISAFCI